MTAYIMMLVLGGGEGAVPLERPSFFVLNFCSRAYLHLKKKNPQEYQHFTVFAALETIIFKISVPVSPSIATQGPFTEGAEHKMFLQHSGFTACQSASHTLPTNPLQRPPISCLSLLRSSTFACLSMLWSPAISCSTCSKLQSPHFSLCCGTDLHVPQFGPRSLPLHLHPDASLQILD